jgi:uncharacterized protein YkwD
LWIVLALVLLPLVAACSAPPPNHALRRPSPQLAVSAEQSAAVVLVNAFRAEHGAQALHETGELDVKAQAQAQRMADAQRLFHSTSLPAGVSPGWESIGENIALAGDLGTAQQWLEQSPPHRANLLDRGFDQVGTGVAFSDGTLYLVQDFVGR